MASPSPAQDTKESLISEAREYGEERKYTKCLGKWKEILDLNVELSNDQMIEVRKAARSLRQLLPMLEFLYLSSKANVTHSELAISVIDTLIQTEKNAERIGRLLRVRWNHDWELDKGVVSRKKRMEFYVRKAREVYARFSPTHSERIKRILDYICRLDNNERMQMEELQRLKEEVEAARGDLERMTEQERKESEQWLRAVKRHLKNIPKKNELKTKAREEGEKGRFFERAKLWWQIVGLNLVLSYNERHKLREACKPLQKPNLTDWCWKWDHSLYAARAIKRYVEQAFMFYIGERRQLFSLLWENEVVYRKIRANDQLLGLTQLIKRSYEKERISVDNAERTSLCAHFLAMMEDGEKKLEELRKLADEVEDVWKTHPSWKDAAKLTELSKVKTEVDRLENLDLSRSSKGNVFTFIIS